MAPRKYFCQNTHHSIRPAEEALYDSLPSEGINEEACDITAIYPLVTGSHCKAEKILLLPLGSFLLLRTVIS